MISYIRGKIKQKREDSLIIDVNGLAYEVLVSGAVMEALPGAVSADEQLELVTYHYLQVEPSRSKPILIGFLNEIEKEFFEQFITVSGVGPKAAVRALNRPISTIAEAIDKADMAFLRSLPGIGPQRAKEVIAKLQGKVSKYCLLRDKGKAQPRPAGKEDIQEEAMEVLLQLQYKKAEAREMIDKAMEACPQARTAEEVLNQVYRQKRERPIND